ncbi:MAG TPA: hypothetical protein VD884_00395 [Ohtaekwangia sp.]|nr:hypothetical protein [Ohtaekwangia sp.]
MKLPQLFGKTPKHKKFSYSPRFYNEQEEERKERELRIRKELAETPVAEEGNENGAYRQRISGSFKQAKKTATVQSDPSAGMIRLVLLLLITLGLIGFLQFGQVALYVTAALFIPFYLYLKFRTVKK